MTVRKFFKDLFLEVITWKIGYLIWLSVELYIIGTLFWISVLTYPKDAYRADMINYYGIPIPREHYNFIIVFAVVFAIVHFLPLFYYLIKRTKSWKVVGIGTELILWIFFAALMNWTIYDEVNLANSIIAGVCLLLTLTLVITVFLFEKKKTTKQI